MVFDGACPRRLCRATGASNFKNAYILYRGGGIEVIVDIDTGRTSSVRSPQSTVTLYRSGHGENIDKLGGFRNPHRDTATLALRNIRLD